MKALLVIGIFLMFSGIVVAATTPRQTENIPQGKTTSRIITYSVFGGLILVLISWVYSLKPKT